MGVFFRSSILGRLLGSQPTKGTRCQSEICIFKACPVLKDEVLEVLYLLVGGCTDPFEKYWSNMVKLDHLPSDRGWK